MGNLPFPHTPAGWRNGILLTTFLFLLYYVWFFPSLKQVYLDQFWQPNRACYDFDTPDGVCDGKDPQHQGDLEIAVSVPQWVSDFVEREAIVTIQNISDKDIQTTLRVVPGASPNQQRPLKIRIRPDGEKTSVGLSEAFLTVSLPVSSTVTGKFWFQVEDKITETDSIPLYFYLDHKINLQSNVSTVVRWKVLLYSFITVILLPPWSNGLLPTLALFWAWSFEQAEPVQQTTGAAKIKDLMAKLPGWFGRPMTRLIGWLEDRTASPLIWLREFTARYLGWLRGLASWAILLGLAFLILRLSLWGVEFMVAEGAAWMPLPKAVQLIVFLLGYLFLFFALPQWTGILLETFTSRDQRRAESVLLPEVKALLSHQSDLIGKTHDLFDPAAETLQSCHKRSLGEEMAPVPPAAAPTPASEGDNVSDAPSQISESLDDIMARWALSGELWASLNDPNPAVNYGLLMALQRRYPALPEFAPYYLLIESPAWQHRSALERSVRATPSSYLTQGADARLIRSLVDLYELKPVQFGDGVDPLDALARLPEADDILRDRLQAGRLVDAINEALRKAGRSL